MNGLALVLYGMVNAAMVLRGFLVKNRIFEFPFWAGLISMGWFYPQAIGGLNVVETFPDGSYAAAMFFATICTVAMWLAYEKAVSSPESKPGWLDFQFDLNRLYKAGAFLCMAGFFFQWKLMSLPQEMLNASQWSGATVKYHFLASIFRFGFLVLWMIYLSLGKKNSPKFLVFLIPSLLVVFEAAIIRGRRAEMMNLAAYILICPWFVRRFSIPRWILLLGLGLGMVLINSIGVYRAIMNDDDTPLGERLEAALQADYTAESEGVLQKSGHEFKNYIYFRHIIAEEGKYDFGIKHWNGLVFNYVPAQLVGRAVKNGLMFPFKDNTATIAREKYNHTVGVGTTLPGYTDAFGSYWWFGFIKFSIIGWMMGVLYRHAMVGSLLGQLLYVYGLGTAMHAVTHGTHSILLSIWVYFFALGFPALYWARYRGQNEVG